MSTKAAADVIGWRRIWNAMRLPLRSFGVYALTATLTVLLFIALHLVGNRLPFELAVGRLADEFAATPLQDWGMRGGTTNWFTYCEISTSVVADARVAWDNERNVGTALRNAVLLRFIPGWGSPICEVLQAAVLEDVWPEARGQKNTPGETLWANNRYWLGGKALYAIALRYLTVREFHLAIKTLIYCAFFLLALALFRIGWRALVVAAPLLAFGWFFSAVERYFDVADGLPFAWALLAPALGALLLRATSSASAVRVFFFFAGMVSHYLWFFGGGNFLAATLIGVVVWLACEAREQRLRHAPFRYAASCVGVYTAGFAVSFAARVVIISSMVEWSVVWRVFALQVKGRWEQVLAPRPRDLSGRDFATFQEVTRMDAPTFEWLSLTAAGALAMAVLIAGRHAWRRKPALLLDVLWLAALLLPSCVHFLLPNDDGARAARLMFLPLAICCCCLLAVLTRFERRQAAIWIGGFGAATALLYAGTHLVSYWKYQAKLRNARLVSVADEQAVFAVYLLEAHADDRPDSAGGGRSRELIYWKSPCGGSLETVKGLRKFLFLDLEESEGAAERERQFATKFFYKHGQRFLGACGASVLLPDYTQRVRTGQWFDLGNKNSVVVWQREIDLTGWRELVPDGPPAVRAFFDLYLNTERSALVYFRAPCAETDTLARFFLHVQPASADSLPPHRRQRGFDNLDFDFSEVRMRSSAKPGQCVAAVELPSYPVASVYTGQFTVAGLRWEARIDFVAGNAQGR